MNDPRVSPLSRVDIIEWLHWVTIHGTQEQAIEGMNAAGAEILRLRAEIERLEQLVAYGVDMRIALAAEMDAALRAAVDAERKDCENLAILFNAQECAAAIRRRPE